MARKWLVPLICLLGFSIVLIACTPTARPDNVQNGATGNTAYQGDNNYYGGRYISNQDGNTAGRDNGVGFIRYRSANDGRTGDGRGFGARTNRAQAPDLYVDRHALANHIGYLVTNYSQIDDAVVLVTDDHVFVGIDDGTGGQLDDKTVEQVRKTALAVTPRYYKVHVTDDKTMRKRITQIGDRIGNTGNVTDYRGEVSRILREMGDETPPRPDGINNIESGGKEGRFFNRDGSPSSTAR